MADTSKTTEIGSGLFPAPGDCTEIVALYLPGANPAVETEIEMSPGVIGGPVNVSHVDPGDAE